MSSEGQSTAVEGRRKGHAHGRVTRKPVGSSSDAITGPNNYLAELESLRGIAALLVVLFHLPPWNATLYGIPFIRNGELMVDLFFVLSGFIICRAYGQRIVTARDFLQFQLLRFGRLYPVHLTMLFVAVCIEIIKALAYANGVQPARPQESPSDWIAFLMQIFLVQAIGPTDRTFSFNGPAWSISVEFYTYLLFGSVILWLRRWQVVVFAAIFLAAGFLLVTERHFFQTGPLLRCVAGFSLGCLTHHASMRWASEIGRAPAWLSWFVLGTLIACLSLITNGGHPDLPAWMHGLVAVLSAALFLVLLRPVPGSLNTLLRSPSLQFLGRISYSLYMSHIFVIWAFNQGFRFVLRREPIVIDGRVAPQTSLLEASVAALFVVLLTLVLAWLLHDRIEAPWRARFRRLCARDENDIPSRRSVAA